MSDTQYREREPGTLLTLHIENRLPVSLELLASAFDAMARDYKQLTHRELKVWEVRQGSIFATFAELSEMADSANHLIDFAKHIGGMALAVIGGAMVLLQSKRRKGAKTILALAEIAMKGNAEVRLSHRDHRGEEVTMHITPAQGAMLRKQAPQLRHEPTASIPPPGEDADSPKGLDDEVAAAAKYRLFPLPLPDGGFELTPPLVQELVEALRDRPGGSEALADLAKRLREQGRENSSRLLER